MKRGFLVPFLCLVLLAGLASATPFTADLRTILGTVPAQTWLQLDLRGCGTYIVQGGGTYVPRPIVLRPDGQGRISANVVDESTYTCGGAVGTAYYSVAIFWKDGNGHTVTGPQANYDIVGSATFNLNSAAVKNAYIGAQGEQGPPGPSGPAGPAGSQWYEGSGAPNSGTGANNDFYLDTATGDVYRKQSSTWSVVANVMGPAGAAGARGADGSAGSNGAPGATWYASAGAPSSGIGANNDYYLNSTNGDVYQKQSGTWTQVANIKGPAGAQGASGSQGIQGIPGASGSAWYQGAGAPSSGTGVNNDYYLNSTNGDVYQKQSGTWTVIGNIKGPAGPQGIQGTAGGTTNWRGTWNSGATYHSSSYDAIQYNGSSYLAIADSTNQAPPNPTYWQLLAQAGTTGSTWYNAAGVPSSGTGNDGDYDLNTSNGDVYHKISGSWSLTGNIRGATGAQGSTGAAGATWYQGAGVPSSGTGANGDFDLNTSNGDVYEKQTGSWVLIGNFKGPAGATGAAGANGSNGTNGATWTSGSGAPSGGADGDFYFNTTTSDVSKKTSGTWNVIANIKGAAGATGAQGSAGAAGTNGATWYQGAGAPSSGTGANGDFDLNNSTGDVYQKQSGSWVLVANIKGPPGTATAPGTTKDVPYNSGSQLAADSGNFTYDPSTKVLTAGGFNSTGTASPDQMTAQAAPGSNPSGSNILFWFDSTNQVASFLNSAGKKSISVVPVAAGLCFNGLGADGVFLTQTCGGGAPTPPAISTTTSGDYGATPASPGVNVFTTSSTSATDTSIDLYAYAPQTSYHHPFSVGVQQAGTIWPQITVCNNAHVGVDLFGSALPCSALSTSPVSKTWFTAATNAHTVQTLLHTGAGFNGTLQRLYTVNTGTGFNFLVGCSGASAVDGSCTSNLFQWRGDGKLFLPASTTGGSPLNLGAGVAPTVPIDGDVWATSGGLYARINGATQGPFIAGSIPDGTTATTQSTTDNSAKVATDAFVKANVPTSVAQLYVDLRNAPYYVSCAATGATPITTTTSGSVTSGSTTIPVASTASFLANQGIYIAGAGTAGANYLGTVQSIGTGTIVVSPATGTTVNNALVQHDESAALNAAISDLAAATVNGSVLLPSGVCLFNGPLLQTSTANAIVPMPLVPYGTSAVGPMLAISISGTVNPAWTLGILSGLTVSPTFQGTIIQTSATAGSLFGGKNTSDGGFGPFTGVHLRFKDLTFRTIDNPQVMMINGRYIAALDVENSSFDTWAGGARTVPTMPTHSNGIAIATPGVNNWASTYIRNVQITGYYTGLEWGEHCVLDTVSFNADLYGIVVTAATGHAGYASRVLMQQTAYGLSATSSTRVFMSALEVEDNGLNGWTPPSNYALIYDPNNYLTGVVNITDGADNPASMKYGANNLTINFSPSSPGTQILGNRFWSKGTLRDFIASPDKNNITVTEGPQNVTIAFPTPAIGAANGLISTAFDFTSKTVGVRVPIVSPDTSAYTLFVIGNDNQNWVRIFLNSTTLTFQKDIGGSQTTVATATYNQNAMLYWRMSESSGTITASYSPDASTWTTLGSTTVSWARTATNIELELGLSGSPALASSGFSMFDQFFIGTPNTAWSGNPHWSSLGNATADLTLDNTSYNTTITQASTTSYTLGTDAQGSPDYPAIALVSSGTATYNHATATLDTTGATLLVALLNGYNADETISDSLGNSWHYLTTRGSGSKARMRIGYAYDHGGSALSVGSSDVFTAGSGGGYGSAIIYAFSGTKTDSTVFDTENGVGTNNSASPFQAGSITPTQGDVIVTGFASQTNTTTATIDSSFATPIIQDYATDDTGAASYLITTTASAVNPTWTTNGTNNNVAIASFKPPGYGSGSNKNSPSQKLVGSYWNGTAAAADTWTCQDVLGTGANPTSTLTCAHSGSSGAATVVMPGIPQVETPTAGHGACIKSAGPPVVIGYCSTALDSSGLCTCN